MPIKRSLRTRRPTSQLMAAPASGAKMIRLSRCVLFTFRALCALGCDFDVLCHSSIYIKAQSSKLQCAGVIDIQRFAAAKDRDNNSQTHRGLGGGDGHHNKNKKLPRNITKKTGEG